jgi:hypothetical protein
MYPFHPRHGETVLVRRRFTYRGTELVAIAQPDGTLTCIPEWMTRESAARIKLTAEPHFSLEDLRSLRVEIDRLLVFLPSDSKGEIAEYDAKKRNSRTVATAAVRSSTAKRGPVTYPEDSTVGSARSTVSRHRRVARDQRARR